MLAPLDFAIASSAGATALPIVIIGGGPVGMRVAAELPRRGVMRPIILYGAEPEAPYNRVRLTSLLAGEITWNAWWGAAAMTCSTGVELRLGRAITSIDRTARTVTDAAGDVQPFAQLIIATGSRPRIPRVANVALAGVYTFRDMADAARLVARRMRSRCTVVLGGGLLGLEAARGMRRYQTKVIVVEHASRPMPRQLDEAAGQRLTAHLAALGIELRTGQGVKQILGECRVSGVQLLDGSTIGCDTVIIATGIQPNMELARSAGLSVGRAIRVDDMMRTSDPSIFAVGECAEHRGIVYGLVAPGFEQAAVAAAVIAGQSAVYRGSQAATRLKILDLPVFSIGRVTDDDLPVQAARCVYKDGNSYRKLATERGKLVGALGIGDFPQLGRVQEAVTHGRTLWPWQRWRFQRTGSLWPTPAVENVQHWADNVTVCNCTGVTRGTLGKAMAGGACNVAALAAATGASSVCGSCRPLLMQLCDSREPLPAVRAARSLLALSCVASLLAIVVLLPVALHYSESVQGPTLDFLWRENFWKQVSGYSVLALSVLALVLSLRKRVKRIAWGDFGHWRVVHVACSALALTVLLAHTGGRLGANLNRWLLACFCALALCGGAAAVLTAVQHRLQFDSTRLRTQLTWVHLLLFWPVPVLLAFHIVKSYYF